MYRRRFILENYLYQAERVKHPDYDVLDIFSVSFLTKISRVFKRV